MTCLATEMAAEQVALISADLDHLVNLLSILDVIGCEGISTTHLRPRVHSLQVCMESQAARINERHDGILLKMLLCADIAIEPGSTADADSCLTALRNVMVLLASLVSSDAVSMSLASFEDSLDGARVAMLGAVEALQIAMLAISELIRVGAHHKASAGPAEAVTAGIGPPYIHAPTRRNGVARRAAVPA